MEAERVKAQEMMDELARLRAQLTDQTGEQSAAEPVAVAPEESQGE